MGQSVGGSKTGVPFDTQAELELSHMYFVWGLNPPSLPQWTQQCYELHKNLFMHKVVLGAILESLGFLELNNNLPLSLH